jgi:hypothetical protein
MLLWICYAFSDTYSAYKVIKEGLTIPSGITKLALMEKVMLTINPLPPSRKNWADG